MKPAAHINFTEPELREMISLVWTEYSLVLRKTYNEWTDEDSKRCGQLLSFHSKLMRHKNAMISGVKAG